jgi:hypothetical protein
MFVGRVEMPNALQIWRSRALAKCKVFIGVHVVSCVEEMLDG